MTDAFDARFGTETATFADGDYEPSRLDIVDEALASVDWKPEDCAFVDLGCGKGRVVLHASQRGYRQVLGIEHQLPLYSLALANLARFRERADIRSPVEIVCADAREAVLPDDPLIVYLYNPFVTEVFGAVLGRLRGRSVRIVYVNPVDSALVGIFGFRPIAAGGVDPWGWIVFQ